MVRFTARDEEFLRSLVKANGRIFYRNLNHKARARLRRLIDMRLAAVEPDDRVVAVQPAEPSGEGLRLV
jgi:hypothetical protein